MPSPPYLRASEFEMRMLPYKSGGLEADKYPERNICYQLALTIQLERANFLRQCEKVVSGFERGPPDALRGRHVVAEGADMDDAHGPGRCVLCGRREKGKEQLGEINVACGRQ